jgi:hypothetical protein
MIIVFIVQQNPYDDFTVEAAKTQGKKQGIASFGRGPVGLDFFIRE